MKYKNIKSGVVIETTSKITGTLWKPLDEIEKTNEIKETIEKEEVPTEDYIEEEIDLEAMTNKQLEDFAKDNGVKLTTEDKKNKDTRIAAIVKAFE